jgi:hypothetical protein
LVIVTNNNDQISLGQDDRDGAMERCDENHGT